LSAKTSKPGVETSEVVQTTENSVVPTLVAWTSWIVTAPHAVEAAAASAAQPARRLERRQDMWITWRGNAVTVGTAQPGRPCGRDRCDPRGEYSPFHRSAR